MRLYWKFLRPDRSSPFTRYAWPEPGQWVDVAAAEPCRHGIHACRPADLPYWLLDELWQVELAGVVVAAPSKVVATRARLVAPVVAWDAQAQRDFAAACARRTFGHAVDELRSAGLDGPADRLAAGAPDDPARADLADELATEAEATGHRAAAWLCGYAADALRSLGVEPLAALAYIAARAAGQRSDSDDPHPRTAERAWQAGWLARRLDLPQP
jgi:hypothetical protein